MVLRQAVDLLLAEAPVDLPGPAALERLRVLLACAEQLKAVQLEAVRDLDRRELYALDAAGSARGWLRRQPGGEDGQVTLARRLAQRPVVGAALTQARIGMRGEAQLCTALDDVPADLDDALVTAVLQDGIGQLLLQQTGGTPEDDTAAAAVLTQRAADNALLAACCADTTAMPAARLEPAFVLLAERLPPASSAPPCTCCSTRCTPTAPTSPSPTRTTCSCGPWPTATSTCAACSTRRPDSSWPPRSNTACTPHAPPPPPQQPPPPPHGRQPTKTPNTTRTPTSTRPTPTRLTPTRWSPGTRHWPTPTAEQHGAPPPPTATGAAPTVDPTARCA